MHDHHKRPGSLDRDPADAASSGGPAEDASRSKRAPKGPMGSVGFVIVLAAAGFLLWRFVGGFFGSGPC
jgi:hypothetical protein